MTQNNWYHDKQKRDKWVQFVQTLNPEIDPRAVRLMDELRHVSRTIYHVGEQSITEAGLSLAKYRILMHLLFAEKLGERGELNPSEISERQGVSRNTVSALIRHLEEEGLVARRLDQHDRRKFNISLTPAGRTLVTEHARHHLHSIGHCFSALAPDEQEQLFQLLHRIGRHAALTIPAAAER